jgi:hypothetical protein
MKKWRWLGRWLPETATLQTGSVHHYVASMRYSAILIGIEDKMTVQRRLKSRVRETNGGGSRTTQTYVATTT